MGFLSGSSEVGFVENYGLTNPLYEKEGHLLGTAWIISRIS